MTTVSIGGAIACMLYALYPDVGYVSALLIGFLLGAEFDVLAFLIKRYYGNVAYGRIYGVIFGVFYLGSGLGIWGSAEDPRAVGQQLRQRPVRRGRASWSPRRSSWCSCRSIATASATAPQPVPARPPPQTV